MRLHTHRARGFREGLAGFSLFLAASVTVVAIMAIFLFLGYFTWPVISSRESISVLKWGWHPFHGEFGILSMVVGSLLLSMTAVAISFPISFGLVCCTLGVLPSGLKALCQGIIRFMACIPTVVYGFAGVFLLVPFFRWSFSYGSGYSLLSGAVAVSILILPTMVLVMHSAFSQYEERYGATVGALGMNTVQKVLWVYVPQLKKVLLAAVLLGFARAIGDTILPLMLSGNSAQVPISPLDSVRTLTSHIALVVATDSSSMAYNSLFVSGLLLFMISFGVNGFVRLVVGRRL